MNKILLVIVILMIGLGAFTFLGNKRTAPATSTKQLEPIGSQETTSGGTEADKQNVNVVLGNSGFTPKDIIIKVGTRVIWINKSGAAATVSSGDHPTHLLYSFLNLGEFADSSSVQVIFNKAGKFSYHNHLNPSQTGSVTVE